MGMARTKGSDGSKTKERIRQKALELITRHGFEALTMRQLAAAAGLQVGALYYHFPDKQALLFALMEAHLSALLEVNQPDGETPTDRLKRFCQTNILFHVAHRQAGHVANNELRSLNRENLAAILKLRGSYEKRLRQVLVDGSAASVFDVPQPQLMSAAILGMLNEVCVWHRDGGTQTLEEVAEGYSKAAVRMARGE
jgi:AcrR family transcriptional regulator